jgi:hypothetical protein
VDKQLAHIDREAKSALQEQQASFNQQMVEFQSGVAARAASAERVRQEIERWANPILDAVNSLQNRLNNILKHEGYLVLSPETKASSTGWSIDYNYFLPSTVFLFCQYFCWVRLLQERLRFDLFRHGLERDAFMRKIRSVGETLSEFPYKPLDDLPPGPDWQVFALQQRALGEALVQGEGNDEHCMRFADFLALWNDDAFRGGFTPLVTLLQGLTEEDQRRWRRLELTSKALTKLAKECRRVLTPAQGADPASPSSVLQKR